MICIFWYIAKSNLMYIRYVNTYDKNHYQEKIWKAAVYKLENVCIELDG